MDRVAVHVFMEELRRKDYKKLGEEDSVSNPDMAALQLRARSRRLSRVVKCKTV
jgi:hypothetical protein